MPTPHLMIDQHFFMDWCSFACMCTFCVPLLHLTPCTHAFFCMVRPTFGGQIFKNFLGLKSWLKRLGKGRGPPKDEGKCLFYPCTHGVLKQNWFSKVWEAAEKLPHLSPTVRDMNPRISRMVSTWLRGKLCFLALVLILAPCIC
jgi:hypothetical protein